MEKLSTGKLNYKRTLLVGFAFFLIIAFWQAYDNIIPKILTDKFGLSQTWSGAIMALDNLLALFLLPLFGSFSDKCKSKRGRRTPFIVIGTLLAVVLFVSLSFVDQMQLSKLRSVSEVDNREALEEIYDAEADRVTYQVDGEKKTLRDLYSREQFASIRSTDQNGDANPDYNTYVVPARQSYAWQKTVASPATIVFFVLILFGILLSMGIFRSPAVALMPDVTPKPLRSKANAIINLMGSIGGVLVLVLGMIFGTGKAENVLMSYLPFFIAVAAIMMVSLVIFILTVKEPRWAAEADAANADLTDEEPENNSGARIIKKDELISLMLILASVALWYMGYNAVTSKYSVYAGSVLNLDYNLTLLIAQAAAILSYLPIGMLSSKFGRKKTILVGVLILAASFGGAAFLRAGSPAIVMNILFVLAGIGWATINVNSYPMVVELARGGDVGKYTGFYYTASMAAQILTPVLSGVFLDLIDMTVLFPYATIFVMLSFVTMLFVRHGDVKPKPPRASIEILGQND